MRIKKFNNFQKIDESFGQSKEYEDVLKRFSKEKSFFFDNLMEVQDLLKVRRVEFYNYIVDKNGHMINVNVEGEEHIIKYVINIIYEKNSNSTLDMNDFFKEVDDINLIKTAIEELIDRCSVSLKLSYSKVLQHDNSLNFIIHFEEKMNNIELSKAYQKWSKFSDSEYREGLEKLSEIYDRQNIDFNKYMTIMDEGNYIHIGFIDDSEELYGVAIYDKVKKEFSINEDELKSSIESVIEID
jgi:hypothetical protein